MFKTLCHVRREDLLHYDTTKCKIITAALLLDVCKDVELAISFFTLNGDEQTMRKIAKTNDEVRLDICAKSFWMIGQKAFFDVRVFYPTVRRYSKETLKQCYSLSEHEKKRHYNTRIMEVDQGSFTPLFFTVAGVIRNKGRGFYLRLATLLSLKNGTEKSKGTSSVQFKVNFALLRLYVVVFKRLTKKVNE